MEEYKPNSYKSKEEAKQADISTKKVEKVINGSVKVKKKGFTEKFMSVFMPDDVTNIKSYIFTDVLVPSAKKIITEVVDTMLYGGSGGSRRRSSSTKVSYGRYYDRERENDRRRDTRVQSRGYDYDDIIFETRGEAEAVLDAMNDIIERYGVVSINDLYDLVDISTNNYTTNKYGWTDISGCKAVKVRDGYILKLPKALPID